MLLHNYGRQPNDADGRGETAPYGSRKGSADLGFWENRQVRSENRASSAGAGGRHADFGTNFPTADLGFLVAKANPDERRTPPVGKACCMAHQRSTIKLFCEGDARTAHKPRTVARYSWSELDGVWVRSDRHGSDDDWYMRTGPDGAIQAYPRPRLECPCGNGPVYTHDELQAMIQQAVSEDRRLTV